MKYAVGVLLAVAVLGAWIGVLGFARLRAPLDRLHCAAFCNTVCGAALTLATFLADGVSERAFKVAFILILNCVGGALVSHVTGRALVTRDGA